MRILITFRFSHLRYATVASGWTAVMLLVGTRDSIMFLDSRSSRKFRIYVWERAPVGLKIWFLQPGNLASMAVWV